MKPSRYRPRWKWAALAALTCTLVAGAQTAHPRGSFLTPRSIQSQHVVALEHEDEESVYRHSPSVRAVGKLLHLGPEAAARLFEDLNFAILAGAVLSFLIGQLPGALRARRESLAKQLRDARTATEQANERLTAVERRLSLLDQEIDAIRGQAERESAQDEARIRAAMEQERQRIVESAEREIASAATAAQRELKRFAGALAVEIAASRVALTGEMDRALVRRFAQELGGKGRRGGGN